MSAKKNVQKYTEVEKKTKSTQNKKLAKTTAAPKVIAAQGKIKKAVDEKQKATLSKVSETLKKISLEGQIIQEATVAAVTVTTTTTTATTTPVVAPVSRAIVKDDITPQNTRRDKLIVEYAPLIKYISQRIAARLPANIELDDLMSSAVIGLMDAIDKYDPSRDNKFKTYAEFRIRGAILDELRAQDWVPRSVREKAKTLERTYTRLEQEKGRQATDEEVCKELNLSQEEFYDMLNQVRSVSLLSFEDISNFSKADKRSLQSIGEIGGKMATPFNEVSTASVKQMIAEAIRELPEKQRLVLSLYYYEDLNLKEIGRVLDVTESRVSQLHTQAILRLKGKLKSHWDEFVTLMG